MQSRYAEIPADINRRLQEVQLSLQREEEKVTESTLKATQSVSHQTSYFIMCMHVCVCVCGHSTAHGEEQPSSEAGPSGGGVRFRSGESETVAGEEESNSQPSRKCSQGVCLCASFNMFPYSSSAYF